MGVKAPVRSGCWFLVKYFAKISIESQLAARCFISDSDLSLVCHYRAGMPANCLVFFVVRKMSKIGLGFVVKVHKIFLKPIELSDFLLPGACDIFCVN